jgi:hypothetical protein
LGNKDEGDGSDGENQSPFLTGMKEMEGMGRTKGWRGWGEPRIIFVSLFIDFIPLIPCIPDKLCSCVVKQG